MHELKKVPCTDCPEDITSLKAPGSMYSYPTTKNSKLKNRGCHGGCARMDGRKRNEIHWPTANGVHRFQPKWLRAMINIVIMMMMATIATSTHIKNCDWI